MDVFCVLYHTTYDRWNRELDKRNQPWLLTPQGDTLLYKDMPTRTNISQMDHEEVRFSAIDQIAQIVQIAKFPNHGMEAFCCTIDVRLKQHTKGMSLYHPPASVYHHRIKWPSLDVSIVRQLYIGMPTKHKKKYDTDIMLSTFFFFVSKIIQHWKKA